MGSADRLATLLLLLLLVAQPLLVVAPSASAQGDDGSRVGTDLRVDGPRVVAGTETWDRVVVTPTGLLRIEAGGTMTASSVELEAGSRLVVEGGTLLVSGGPEGGRCGIWGACSELLVLDSGAVLIEGVASTGPTRGGEAWLNVSVSDRVRIIDSQVLVLGGEGLSPDSPTTDGDVAGSEHAGGDALLSITLGPTGSSVAIQRSGVTVEGGAGGDAPDGRPSNGGFDGEAGGFTSGGNVSGEVATGGGTSMSLSAPVIEVTGSVIAVTGGRGGDAGDGASVSGSHGGGGGGYSGGAGGSWYSQAGAPGGAVSGTTGSGGDASMLLVAPLVLDVAGSTIKVAGGTGGDAGDGGDCHVDSILEPSGGAGGGGYSGGGGGGRGESTVPFPPGDGGPGGAVSGRVARGGDASLVLRAPEATVTGSSLEATGGQGGRGGVAGASTCKQADGTHAIGGGGGSYSSGGGAGAPMNHPTGAGGAAGPVSGQVGDGGDALLLVDCPLATIPENSSFSAAPGAGGVCWRSSAQGTVGGEGAGRVTERGLHQLHVPASRVPLLSPGDGEVGSEVPVFTWARPQDGSSAGQVVAFEFEMDDDPSFGSVELRVSSSSNFASPSWVPNFTSHWRVRALYQRPWQQPGPWSEARSFTYVNLPPTIGELPTLDVLVGETVVVDLSPYITDPDDTHGQLSLSSSDTNVLSTSRLNLSLYFDREVGTVPVEFQVHDRLSTVTGVLMVTVSRYRHPPYILGITNHIPPLELELLEGTEAWYDILVHDVDSDEFTYWTTGSWEGATAHENGTLHVRVARGEVGEHTFRLRVADEGGREASMEVTVIALNVNDPPDPPAITSPSKRITVREGEAVYFQALVSDPDLPLGQVLNVTFVSNETGLLRTVSTTTLASMSHASLPVGRHRITVVVSDGQYSSSDFVEVVVEAPPVPPPVHTSERTEPDLWPYLAGSILLFAAGLAGGDRHRRWRHRRRGGGEPS